MSLGAAPSGGSIRNQWAQYHVTRHLRKAYNKFYGDLNGIGPGRPLGEDEDLPDLRHHELAHRLIDMPAGRPADASPTVCTVGAGAAGLFTALLFDYLNQNVSGFNVQYEIFESQQSTAKSGRGVGGRLYTYNFDNVNPHPYYDVGAMRFPQNPIMLRTFCLFDYLGMEISSGTAKDSPPLGSIIPYYMTGQNEPWCFNGINQTGSYSAFASSATDNDPFEMNLDQSDPTLQQAMQVAATSTATDLSPSPDTVLEFAIAPYKEALINDPAAGWQLLMTIDKQSTTEFLASDPVIPDPQAPIMTPFDYSTIEWLETFGGGTNWYDQAHSETVLESLDFNYGSTSPTNWFCIEGGAQQLAFIMATKLQNQNSISFGSQITGIDISTPSAAKVQLDSQWQGSYAGIFNSTTMGCMQQMDLTNAGLTYGQKQAIRSLGYGASAKVGMQFSEPWWITTFTINQGGLGHSDLPTRTTVYPSYNLKDDPTKPAVLLCSYEWQQDAQRISTLISSSSDYDTAKAEEAALKELVLRDLALLHAKQPDTMMSADEVYSLIAPLYIDHYAHDWYHDPATFGAFAFFRPQQFGSMWPSIIAPSPGLVMIGEHASNHHAWVVGALESAVHGVHGWLSQNTDTVAGAQAAMEAMEGWGPEPTPQNPFAGLPPFASLNQRRWQDVFGRLLYRKEFLEKGKGGGE